MHPSRTTVHLYVLDTGVISSSDYSMWSPSVAPGTHRDMSVRSYLVVHPDGVLLWDTGIADAIAANRSGEPIVDTVVFRVPTTLRTQLEAISREPDLVGLSHMHIDHVGNLDQFPDAKVVMQQAEHDAAYGPNAEQLTYIPEAYAGLHRGRIETIAGEHDVFNDQTVIMTPLPGHTPGHQGLLVALPETGPVLLAGDIAYSAEDYAKSAVRQGNVDLEASRRSIEAAKALERDGGATVWLHHDLDAQRSIRTAPSLYT
jgi:N-acyl homoserine lactone hydrolase